MPNKAGWSKRTTCAKCGTPTAHTRLCNKDRDAENILRARKRAEFAEEGRCVTCSRIVLELNPKTDDLYKTCKICRRRKTLIGYGKTTDQINIALQAIGGRAPNPNAAPKEINQEVTKTRLHSGPKPKDIPNPTNHQRA